MMRNMCGPEKADMVIYPVQPVIHEIFKNNQRDPIYPGILNNPGNTMIIKKSEDDADIHGTECKIKAAIQQHQVNILKSIFPGITFPRTHVAQQYFHPDDNNIERGG